MPTQKKTNELSPKQLMLLPDIWKDSVETKTKEELESEIIKCQQEITSTELDMAEDDKLQAAKALVKDLSSAYRDSIKVEKLKTKHVLHIMRQRGYY